MEDQRSITRYVGVVLDDRYEICEKIGEGGMAIVYKALDVRLSRYVAVKIMRDEFFNDAEFKKKFFDEAHAVAMLSHPNIVAIYDVSNNSAIDYIVMELISGITLRQYIDKKHIVPWKQVLHFAKQIAAALSHAHSKKVIHRDIKPQNIMLRQDGTIKVADFGIAALENAVHENKGQAIGSLNYIAPEQLRGFPADVRGDVYSLGVTLYEMLCGFKPYVGETPAEILNKQKTSEALPPRSYDATIPEGLEEIVMKALESDIDKRYQSASEMLDALEKFTTQYIKTENRPKKDSEEGEKPLKVKVTPVMNIPRKEYIKSVRRTNKIGFSLGSFAVIAAVLATFSLLWNYWMKDIFAQAERMELPNFVGSSYESIANDIVLTSRYNFVVDYVVDTSTPAGTVLSQNPGAGRSLMVIEGGQKVKLSVSTGYVLTEVVNVIDKDYREAMLELQNAGFSVEISTVKSATAQKDHVISTSPGAGEKISAGSTVYITVSGGTETKFVKMPNLVGLSEEAAISKLQSANLTFAGSNRVASDYDAGTVISQSIVAFADVEEYSGITLTVAAGPGVFN